MDAPYLKNIDLPMDAIRAFCERHHIQRMALFGSVLRDDFRPAGDDPSDIDVLIEFEPDTHYTLFELGGMQQELESIFGRFVDLKPPRFMAQQIRQAVDSALVWIYERR